MSNSPRFGVWTPVGEALPDMDHLVLAFDRWKGCQKADYNPFLRRWWAGAAGRLLDVTHWMPLPPPPGREEAADGP